MLLDRLRKGLLRLQGTYGVEFTDSVYYGAPFQALLTLVIEDLHQLYPAYIPPGRRYQFLQHLAVLDLQLQQVATQPTYLDNVANRHHLRQVLIAALDYTLQYSQSDAV
jgi:hypothetical protein